MDYRKDVIAYAVKLKDENELMKSSSGGMFTSLSNYVLDNHGVIFASSYNYKYDYLQFAKAETYEDRDKMRGSIYFQSDMRGAHSAIENTIREFNDLALRKPILVLGTPCQINSVIKFLAERRVSYKSLILCDLVCHGVPSPGIWENYVNNIKNKYSASGEIVYITFKDKKDGWDAPRAKIKFTSEEVYLDDYMKLFYSNLTLRPSCYKCPYTTVYRKSDLTIGDFWSIKKYYPNFYSNKGVSTVLVHSLKGKQLLEVVSDSVSIMNCKINECLQPNLISPTQRPKLRDMFWNDYDKHGFQYVLNRYTSLSIKNRFLRKMFQYIPLKTIMRLVDDKKRSQGSLFLDKKYLEIFCFFHDKYNCCGCSACYSICSQKAIEMIRDNEGFLYPKINLAKCIGCHRCIKVCEFKNKKLF